MFERWTDRARRIVILAQEEARMMNHDCIGTGHFLLGMIAEGECVAAQALKGVGVPGLEAVREQVAGIIPAGRAAVPGHLPFTPRAKKVTELALREALQLGNSYIGTEHVLLAVEREGEGTAMKALAAVGVSRGDVRAKVLELLRGYEKPAGDSLPALPPSPVMVKLDEILSRLGAIERHLGITGLGEDGSEHA
jgi:ATP-dependent Clp protease ATP-binding subunit ClpC